jgi:NADH:ubiquinone oxidoreductase subunit 5 (subunit L)/multisubunit Na+/H+ antiporter MnhA subunit
MNESVTIITLPLIIGLLLFIFPEKYRTIKGITALMISVITFWLTIIIYRSDSQILTNDSTFIFSVIFSSLHDIIRSSANYFILNNDDLSSLIILFISLFAFLVLLYSLVYIKEGRVKNYYPYFMITLGCSYGAVLSDNLLLFLFFWGILGITLYKLIYGHNESSSAAAKKTLIQYYDSWNSNFMEDYRITQH